MVRTVKGKAYPIVVRTLNDKDWETVLDVNEVAAPLKYCSVGAFRPDPSHDILAYSIDPSGYETYEVRFKDLVTGEDLPDVIKGTAAASAGATATPPPATGRCTTPRRTTHTGRIRFGATSSALTNPRTRASCTNPTSCSTSASAGRARAGSCWDRVGGTETNEVHYVDITAGPGANQSLVLMEPRRMGHRYYPEHRGDHWFIPTNPDGKINFDLVRARWLRRRRNTGRKCRARRAAAAKDATASAAATGARSSGPRAGPSSPYARLRTSRARGPGGRVQRRVGAPPD